MKRSIIAGNWKMYATSVADAHVIATTVRNNVAHFENIEVIICPPAVWLTEVSNIVKDSPRVKVGAQNISSEVDGAYTGEISALMVKEIARYSIVGHSERREYFGEKDFDVNEKVLLALKAGISPIICVGEKKKSGSSGQPVRELKEALLHIPKKYHKDIIVAYEPVWAISSPTKHENADPEYVAKVHVKLRELVSFDTPILYGGSVNSKNVKEYAERPEIDGVLVGGASVRVSEFVKICKIWSETKSLK